MVVKTFMDMDQDSEEEKELYLNLALHLASDFFLKHPDKDVRLLVACCLADIFRIYAPEAPYTSPDKLKVPSWEGGCAQTGLKRPALMAAPCCSPHSASDLFAGHFHVHHQTAERPGGHKKCSVQPILLSAGGTCPARLQGVLPVHWETRRSFKRG